MHIHTYYGLSALFVSCLLLNLTRPSASFLYIDLVACLLILAWSRTRHNASRSCVFNPRQRLYCRMAGILIGILEVCDRFFVHGDSLWAKVCREARSRYLDSLLIDSGSGTANCHTGIILPLSPGR